MSHFTAMTTIDVRFPTSRELDGSDAMNPDPDYSAAYVILHTDAADGHEGHGFAFTIGRGNEVQISAIEALAHFVVGREVESTLADLGTVSAAMVGDSQLRWLGPEKGVMHMAIGAVMNALWDLKAKRADEPLWRLLSLMAPEDLVALVDFRYIADALTPDEALLILRSAEPSRQSRIDELMSEGFPAYTTTPGWLGYSDDKLRRLAGEAVAAGFTQIKLKVGADKDDDLRRLQVARTTVGEGFPIAVDANQRWNVDEAIQWVKDLQGYEIHWIEEPTSPDDILGLARIRTAIAPIRIATGEHVQNRVIFKQLLQAEAIDVMQIDATRVGGVNEIVAILLLAAKFGIPVCPHAGGVGLCEMVQHLAMFDRVAVSARKEGRIVEYADHLHEHFVDPVRIRQGSYLPPSAPGYSTQMRGESLARFSYPDGPAWTVDAGGEQPSA